MIPTPHIEVNNLDTIAKTVLMPGDPLRAEYIANTYLTNVVKFNNVRNMFGYTGYYKKKKVSVMGSGMGMPSIGIYSYELFAFYNVDNIIRIGSAGSYKSDLKIYDCVLANSAYSESTYAKTLGVTNSKKIKPSNKLNNKLIKSATKLNIDLTVGTIHSSDVFYRETPKEVIEANQLLAVEMESFALFSNAKKLGKNASCLLTISDNLVTHEQTSSEERQKSFNNMMLIALESI
jgi:purine-nucleoside phosphorylase